MDNKILEQNKTMPYNVMKEHSFEAFDKKLNTKKSQSFKGVPIAAIAHTLENNKIAKMLTTDVGIITGRVTTARNADEAREYLFRDSMSPIFYYASTPLIYKGLQAITKSANTTNIDPVAAKEVTDIMLEQVKANGGHMQVEEFAARTIGTLDDKAKEFLDNLPFQTGEADKKGIFTKVADFFRGLFKVKKPMQEVISLAELKKHLTDAELLKKAEEMAKLQPEQAGIGAVLTKQQVADVLKNGSINAPKFMQKLFKGKFGEDLTNPLRYIPMKKITGFRDTIDQYGNAIIETAKKKNGGVVDEELIKKINKSGFVKSAGFRIFAMGVSALFLGAIIPKLQYAMTKRRTGSSAAPGLRQYEEDKKA